jgi:Xaa-Pro aminopeptidase
LLNLSSRRQALLEQLRDAHIDAFLTTALPNVRYLSGYTGSNAALLITADGALLFTDPRYATQAPLESDCDVKIAKGPLLKEVGKWLKRWRVGALGFVQNRISLGAFEQLSAEAKGTKLQPLQGVVEELRSVKSEDEIGAIRASVQLNSAALEQALEHFQPEMSETDLAAEIDYRMRLLGADGVAFDTIVASGKRSALPHAQPTVNPIQTDQLLLIDMGANVAGYASDMTRTFAVGQLSGKQRRLYKAVLESQLAAIDAIKPGVSCAKVDRAARSSLKERDLEQYFVHSTGHGLGLEIHEQPRVGRKEKTKLREGMVVTVEPGVYLEKLGGVRIEDTVLVTASGCEPLTPTRKDLVVL